MPNPNLSAPPFVDGCPLPASSLNRLAGNAPFCPSIVAFGGNGNNTADNAAAIVAASAAGACVSFPPGKFYFSSDVTFTMATHNSSVQLIGAGSGSTWLRFASGHGIKVNFNGSATSAQISGLSILAGGANSGAGLNFVQNAEFPSGSYPAASELRDVFFRGDDTNSDGSLPGSHCWADAFKTDYVSNINFFNVNVYGCRGLNVGNGINIAGGSGEPTIGIVYNIIGGNFFALNNGVVYGPWVQGMVVNNGNFVANNIGIFAPGPHGHQSALTVTSTQFGYCAVSIQDDGGVEPVQIDNNFVFIQPAAGQVGFKLVGDHGFQANNNTIIGVSGFGNLGMRISPTAHGGTIVGNKFFGLEAGPVIDAGAAHIKVANNQYEVMATNYVSNSSTDPTVAVGDVLGDVPVHAVVTGAVDNGSGKMRVTVNSANGLGNGQIVLAGGIGGTNLANQYLVTPVIFIDPTHVDLAIVGFSGSYTSGGSLTTLFP